jgi:hypothetical protein
MAPKVIRHSDVLLAAPGEGGTLIDDRLRGRPAGARRTRHPFSGILFRAGQRVAAAQIR